MTTFKKPEELAFAATEEISAAADKIVDTQIALGMAAAAIAVGLVVTSPTIMPAFAFAVAYRFWDMNRFRKASVNLRNAFIQVSESLGEHDSVHQMDPLKRAFDKVRSYNKDDLNVVSHYKSDKPLTLMMSGLTIIAPPIAPFALSILMSTSDLKKLKAVKKSVTEAQENLLKKYPLTFE